MMLSKGFIALFVTVMLAACGILVFSAITTEMDRARIADLTLSLETSQGRERKQNHEYAQVNDEIPTLKTELAAVQPKADAAAEVETTLRAERKQLRADNKTLTAALAEAEENKIQAIDALAAAQQTALTLQDEAYALINKEVENP